jgi:zinc protease
VNIAPPRPTPWPPRPYRFPDYVRTRFDNGLTLLVAPVRRLPICAVSVVVDAGAELDPPGAEGCALLTARALAEGTRQAPGIVFTERLERIGASLEAAADWDGAHLSLAVMSQRVAEALELLAGVIIQPAFPGAELERLREERISEILQMRSEPRGLANEAFARVVYTADSRYSIPLGGTQATVGTIDREAVERYHRRLFAPERTTVIVAGDVDADVMTRLGERLLGSWRGNATDVVARRGAERLERPRVNVVNRESAPQSELRVGHAGVARAHPAYFPLVMMNAVLGGLFSSRINLNLREEHAFTYGAHSGFDWRRGDGPFVIRTAVESGVTAAAVSEILRETDRIRAESVTEAELSLARDYLVGVFPVRFETSLAIAAGLAQIVTYDLPADYYDSYRDNITRVTAADILDAARSHLDVGRLTVVVVGDGAVITPALEELAPGSVAPLNMDETNVVAVSGAQPPG